MSNEIEKLLNIRLRRMAISNYPTWVDDTNTEGIEIVLGKIRTFWIKGTERVYGEPIGSRIEKILNEIKDLEKPYKPENKQDDKPEQNKDVKFVNQLPDVFEGKRIVVPQDIAELQKMSTFERILLFQKTHPSLIKTKPGRGGKRSYVEGNVMKMEANIAFLFAVSSKIDGWHIDSDGVACYGTMTFNIDGQTVIKSGVGIDLQEYGKETKKPVLTVAEMMKNASTDMQKKILADMGFNGDVYRGEV